MNRPTYLLNTFVDCNQFNSINTINNLCAYESAVKLNNDYYKQHTYQHTYTINFDNDTLLNTIYNKASIDTSPKPNPITSKSTNQTQSTSKSTNIGTTTSTDTGTSISTDTGTGTDTSISTKTSQNLKILQISLDMILSARRCTRECWLKYHQSSQNSQGTQRNADDVSPQIYNNLYLENAERTPLVFVKRFVPTKSKNPSINLETSIDIYSTYHSHNNATNHGNTTHSNTTEHSNTETITLSNDLNNHAKDPKDHGITSSTDSTDSNNSNNSKEYYFLINQKLNNDNEYKFALAFASYTLSTENIILRKGLIRCPLTNSCKIIEISDHDISSVVNYINITVSIISQKESAVPYFLSTMCNSCKQAKYCMPDVLDIPNTKNTSIIDIDLEIDLGIDSSLDLESNNDSTVNNSDGNSSSSNTNDSNNDASKGCNKDYDQNDNDYHNNILNGNIPDTNVLDCNINVADTDVLDCNILYPKVERMDREPVYITSQGSKLSITHNQLNITDKEGETIKKPLGEISEILVFGRIQLTTQLIQTCFRNGIPIIYMTARGEFIGMSINSSFIPKNTNNLTAQITYFQNPEVCQLLAKTIVLAKIKNQRTLIRRNFKASDIVDAAGVFRGAGVTNITNATHTTGIASAKCIADAKGIGKAVDVDIDIKNMENKKASILDNINVLSNKIEYNSVFTINSIMGFEGKAAKYYFDGYEKIINSKSICKELQMNGRTRRPPQDPINAMLSFGYNLLLDDVFSAILREGLSPWFGFMHASRNNKPSLALDLMEEFRTSIVDSIVLYAVSKNIIKITDFEITNYSNEEKQIEQIETNTENQPNETRNNTDISSNTDISDENNIDIDNLIPLNDNNETYPEKKVYLSPEGRKKFIKLYDTKINNMITHPYFKHKCSWRQAIHLQVRILCMFLNQKIPKYIPLEIR